MAAQIQIYWVPINYGDEAIASGEAALARLINDGWWIVTASAFGGQMYYTLQRGTPGH